MCLGLSHHEAWRRVALDNYERGRLIGEAKLRRYATRTELQRELLSIEREIIEHQRQVARWKRRRGLVQRRLKGAE